MLRVADTTTLSRELHEKLPRQNMLVREADGGRKRSNSNNQQSGALRVSVPAMLPVPGIEI